MKSRIIFLWIISGLIFGACNTPRISSESLSQTTIPTTGTPSIPMMSTSMVATNTPAPPSPSPTESQTPKPTAAPTPTQIPPTPVPTSTDDPFSGRLLPDLETLPPTDLRLQFDSNSGRTLIRFSNSIWNSGPGILELIGKPDQTKDQIQVSQRVYAADQDIFDDYEVGEFVFHDHHNHWHLEQFSVYEVWAVDEKGSLEGLVSSGGKVSYCIMDVSKAEIDLSDQSVSTSRNYTNCEGRLQGLSVGWIDIYKSHYWGQWVDITSLDDGIYALISTVNPDHIIHEANVHNNTAITYFEIRELQLKHLGDIFFEEDHYLIPNSYLRP
jgi:hypothetical protein